MSNEYAGGSNTNISGHAFEQRYDLVNVFKNDDRFELEESTESTMKNGHDITVYEKVRNGKRRRIGKILSQTFFYRHLESRSQDSERSWKDVTSKKYLPDDVFINEKNNSAFFFEKKNQKNPGSVDEKIQTAPFKLKQMQKLCGSLLGFDPKNVHYDYILSNYFKSDRFNDVREYYEDNENINLFYEELPEQRYLLNEQDVLAR